MKTRILPLDDIAEYGKTDRVAVVLTIGRAEARNIMEELTGTEELSKHARKLYELMQAIAASPEDRDRAFEIFNTEGRHDSPGCGVTGHVRPRAPIGEINGVPVYDRLD